MRSIALALLMAVTATAALAQPKDALTVDLPGDVATMDPHLQWNTESYTVYRNIFDNLVTRDVAGKIVPQVATAWRYADDTTIVFDLHTDIAFHDGSRPTPEDVVFSVRRVINPAFKSPQLSQFDQITSADVTGPAQVTLHTKTPYPVLMAQLVKLSIVPKAYVDKLAIRSSTRNLGAAARIACAHGSAACNPSSTASTTIGAANHHSALSPSALCQTGRPGLPICARAALTSHAACRPTTPNR
jgi:ABC-type transport system substrate-binding protein